MQNERASSSRVAPFLTRFILLAAAAFFTYSWAVLRSLYYSGKTAYHDLGLLNGIFSNTVHGRGFFWVTHSDYTHFKLQFTPTLLLLLPLYRFMDSQSGLLYLADIAIVGAVLLFLFLFQNMLQRGLEAGALAQIPQSLLKVIPWVLLVLLLTNRYTKNVLTSAHYEIFFPLLWGFLGYCLFENKNWLLTGLAYFLCIGLRSDASFYLLFQMVALFFVPHWTFKNPYNARRKLFVLIPLCILYFLALNTWISPLLGGENNFTRWWGHLGGSVSEITLHVLKTPSLWISALLHGGFFNFNLSFYFLSLFNPIYFFLTNLPAMPSYFLLMPERANLFYYHSGVLLPTFYLGSFLGLVLFLNFLGKKGKRFSYAFIALIFISQAVTWTHTNNGYRFKPYPSTQGPFVEEIQVVLETTPEIHSVASDVSAIVFVPNRFETRVLEQYTHSDLVILPHSGSALLSGAASYEEAVAGILKDPQYQVLRKTAYATYLVKRSGGRS